MRNSRRIQNRNREKKQLTRYKQHAHDRAINNSKPFLPDVPLHPDLLHKPSSLQQNANKINQNPNINLDFEENSPFQEDIISETIQRLDKSFFQNPKELEESYRHRKLNT